MPPWIRAICRYGNAIAAAMFAGMTVYGLATASPGLALLFAALGALAIFDIYVIEKAARFLSEEEILKADVRKAELRKELEALGQYCDAAPAPKK